MAQCNKCLQGGLVWGKVNNKWRLKSGPLLHECLEPTNPVMGIQGEEKRIVDKDLNSRRLQLMGFRFNKKNLEDGLVDEILNGNYFYE